MFITLKRGRLAETDEYGNIVKVQCSNCKELYPITKEYFYWDSKNSIYYAKCKQCHKIVKENWRKSHLDKQASYQSKYYWNNPERSKAWIKAYRQTDKYKQWFKLWRKENIIKLYKKHNARMNFMRSLEYSFSLEQWEECKKYFNHRCAYCGDEVKLTKDHYIPVVLGGIFTKDNIIPACITCNKSKQQKIFDEWYPKQSFYNEDRLNRIKIYLELNKNNS